MSNAAETQPILEPGLDSLATARGFTLMLVEGIPDEKLALRACPDSNHAAYVLGHIAHTDDWLLALFSGAEPALPKTWNALFSGGAEIRDDRTSYPGKAELLDAIEERRRAMVGWLSSLSPEKLTEPIEGDVAQFVPSLAAAPSSLAFHEGFHTGQISTVRRALGIPRLF